MRATENQSASGFMVCVNNADYPASLELGKSYRVLPDDSLGPDEVRVVDDSGEDYVYPADRFSADRGARVTPRDSEPR